MAGVPRYSESDLDALTDGSDAEVRQEDSNNADALPMDDERKIQEDLFQWAELQSGNKPSLRLLYAVPNGQYRPGQRPEPGMKAGVPDCVLPVARGGWSALYLELKRADGRVRDTQEKWLYSLREAGNAAVVAYGFADARDTILRYLSGILEEEDLFP